MFVNKSCRILRLISLHKRPVRFVVNETKTWERKYKRVTRIALEKYWRKRLGEQWENRPLNSVSDEKRKNFYCLSMFPYPSGRLHMGHVRVYTISDTFSLFYRMNGYNVIHPMGWDAFGLPAENAARDRKLNPEDWTRSNISYMKKQLKDLNLTFDWEREFSTCDPGYYKWTQYIFLKLFDAGLAYQKDAVVNWDPVDQTVLADEQVDENGCSWRSGAVVEQRYLKQWFFKTSEYSGSLLDTLHELDEDYGIKAMQRHWIGKIDGCYFNFPLYADDNSKVTSIPVFCSHPEAVAEASQVVFQPKYMKEIAHQLRQNGAESALIDTLEAPYSKNSVLKGLHVENIFTGKFLPVVLSDEFETIFERPIAVLDIPGIDEIHTCENYDVKCSTSTAKDHSRAKRAEILAKAKDLGIGTGKMTSSKLRDWLISRQRYWGTPIPIIHCPKHGPVKVPDEDLPVELPCVTDLNPGAGVSPLQSATQWVNTICPNCGAPSKRETDTMDTFVDSSWYFLRYTDPHNTNEPFSKELADRMMPVDLYIGGKEHATLHLYFARFFSHFLADQGLQSHKEPFKKLLAQGIIKGLTHQIESTSKYISADDVDRSGGRPVTKDTGEAVTESFQKMSKSKLNGVDPEEFVNEWGINLTRLYVLYAAAPFEDIHWDVKTDVIPGVMRWQLKVWTCVTKLLHARKTTPKSEIEGKVDVGILEKVDILNGAINKAIVDVTNHYTKDCVLSAAITCLMTLAKALFQASSGVIASSSEYERGVCALVIMSAPMVPHFASELWCGLRLMEYKLTKQNWEADVLQQPWPQPELNTSVPLTEYKIKVNKRTCHAIKVPTDLEDFAQVKLAVLNHKKVKKRLKGEMPSDFSVDKENSIINIASC